MNRTQPKRTLSGTQETGVGWGIMGTEAAVKNAAPGTVLDALPEGLTTGSSPDLTQEVPSG